MTKTYAWMKTKLILPKEGVVVICPILCNEDIWRSYNVEWLWLMSALIVCLSTICLSTICVSLCILHCITDVKTLNMSCKSVIKQEAIEVINLEAKEGFDICISLRWSKIAFKALTWPRHLLHIIYRMMSGKQR